MLEQVKNSSLAIELLVCVFFSFEIWNSKTFRWKFRTKKLDIKLNSIHWINRLKTARSNAINLDFLFLIRSNVPELFPVVYIINSTSSRRCNPYRGLYLKQKFSITLFALVNFNIWQWDFFFEKRNVHCWKLFRLSNDFKNVLNNNKIENLMDSQNGKIFNKILNA